MSYRAIVCAVAGVLLAIAQPGPTAFATTLASWTFETSQPATAGPFSPEVGSGSATGVGGGTYSSPAGNGSAHSFSTNNWNVGDYWQFQTTTVGYSDITLKWDQASSATGPRDFQLQYSTNGTIFTSYAVLQNGSPNAAWNMTTGNTAYSFSYNLSSITALDNLATAIFRLVDISTTSASGGTVGTSGTDRVDNFTVSATATPLPAALPLFASGLGLMGLLGWRRKRKNAAALAA